MMVESSLKLRNQNAALADHNNLQAPDCDSLHNDNSRYPQSNIGIVYPMHACLNIDEIVRLIALELVASERNATAVGLACCCKSFEDPVLDVLWATQDQLFPLLKSFPGDVWKEGGHSSFKRLPTTTEWARFRKYARKIRELSSQETLPLEVFSVIQLGTINEHLLPNLKTLALWRVEEHFIPFIPLFLSPGTTTIALRFGSGIPEAAIASTITTLPTLCPNLQAISLDALPVDPMITAAVSGMLLVTNRNTLQKLDVDSPLTKEASEVLYQLPSLRSLSVVIEGVPSLPPASLPNLTELTIISDDDDDWPQLFHGATLGKLEFVIFYSHSRQIGDFLGAFERAALSSSVQNTLSRLYLFTGCSWNPSYSALLPFTQMVALDIRFLCDGGCSSTVDDSIVINLSRAMPKLQLLRLGENPCRQFATGVTAKGLVALAHHCQNLSLLRIHFQVTSLSATSVGPGVAPDAESTISWTGCALTDLEVGKIPVPEGSVLMVALTLLRIFPRLIFIDGTDEGWEKVANAICHSKGIFDRSRVTLESSG